ncbi:MAG: HAD-IIA family hydrolase [Bacteroidales bacterium]|nr:HAD-IIA family hydrolase [Bacteroidales bacterium]
MDESRLRAACRKIRHVALDMDGTIYLGSALFPFTPAFLESLRSRGIGYSFLTNNPTRSRKDYVGKLTGMGIQVSEDQVLTSSVATIGYLRAQLPQVRRLFLLGTPSMQREFEEAGFELTRDDPADRPDALVVAFDPTLTYDRFCRAAWWASKRDIPYIATNPDWVCPTDRETILIDCGSLCKALEGAVGRSPDTVIGKPSPLMLNGLCSSLGLRPNEVAVCGDRLYTDVASARNAGCFGVLVLSGETTLGTALAAGPAPDLIAASVAEFGELLKNL